MRFLVALVVAGCGRLDFASIAVAGDGAGGDVAQQPRTPHSSEATVDTAGITNIGDEPDGVHLVFVDNTPGKNGDLVIFRQGDVTTTLKAYVSTDLGATWTRYVIAPTNTIGINAMGGCQDSVGHAFHLTWMDTGAGDQYTRLQPSYTGGDITGFNIVVAHQLFDVGGDSPGPREVTEIVDAAGHHRLAFASTSPSTSTDGEVKLAITTIAAGLAPMAQNEWARATDHTMVSSTDALVAAMAPTADSPASYLLSMSSNLAGGATAPFVVVAGFSADAKLLAWAITPTATGDFTIGATQTLATGFGSTALRADASLSLANAPSGVAMIAYTKLDGLHVATFDTAGALVADGFSQPSTSALLRHAVIGADAASRPAVIYADGAGHLAATLFVGAAWLPPAELATTPTPAGAWSVSNTWHTASGDRFGVYCDDGAATSSTFSTVYWN